MNIKTYKATAKVGRDTIENAGYFSIEQNSDETDKIIKDRLGKLWYWYYISMPIRNIKHWIKNTYRKVRYGFQRMFKGYDDMDTIATYSKFIERYTKILTEYRKYHVNHSAEMTNAEWEAIVDEMLYHLHYMDEQNVVEELERDVPNNWMPCLSTVSDIMSKHNDEFFKLFSKYFYNLWD